VILSQPTVRAILKAGLDPAKLPKIVEMIEHDCRGAKADAPPTLDLFGELQVVTATASAFERFWAVWPNKVGIGAAEKAFAKAVKSIPSTDPVQVMVDAVAQQRTWPKWRDGVMPNPATWLNERRWLDEPPEFTRVERTGHNGDGRQGRVERMLRGAVAATDGPRR